MNRFFVLFLVFFMASSFHYMQAQIDFANLEEEQIYRKGNKYNTWAVTLGYGPVIYYVDVIDYTFFPKDNWKFGPSIMVSKQFNRPWGMDAQFMMADMYGTKNDRYFSGELMDFTVNLTFSFNQFAIFGPIGDKWNIYGKLGFGLVYFRSRQQMLVDGSMNGEPVFKDQYLQVKHVYAHQPGYGRLEDWEEEDYLVMGYDRKEPERQLKKQNEIVIPFGLGVKYRFNKSFDVGTEVLMRRMSADNLDVNMTGADNDSYMYTSFNVTYKIGKKNKRHAAWTYKDFNLAYRQKRQFDPLAQKLDSLKKEIEIIAALDSVVTDTTTIFRETVVYEEGVSASVFFDFDRANITRKSHRSIAKVAKVMRANTSLRIRIVGYCDERGSSDYNVKLSQRRCDAVRNVLVYDYGIDEKRFQIDPKGESDLLSDTQKLKPRGVHMVNRRVDLMMIVE